MPDPAKPAVPSWVVYTAAAFCFVAVVDLPYGLYTLLRWITCAAAISAAIELYRSKLIGWAWALGIVALVFNPLLRFHFEREIWRILDVAAGIVLLIAGRLISRATTGRPRDSGTRW